MKELKLLTLGLLLLAGAFALLVFSNLDPAPLFLGGAVCTFLGLVNVISPSYGPGRAVSAGDVDDARRLADVQHHRFDSPGSP